MKILIDDERNLLPDGSKPDVIIRNPVAAEDILFQIKHLWNAVDLYVDHDLAYADPITNIEFNGYHVMCYIEDMVYMHNCIRPRSITCVSSNGPGRQRIQQVINKLYGRL